MTTLLSYQGPGWAVMGSDSRLTDEGGRISISSVPKIVDNNGILIAGSGASRGSNILQFGWKAPKPTAVEAKDLDTFISQKFIPGMRKVFIDAGYDMKEDGDVASHDSLFLVSVRGVIYCISQDYDWSRDARGIYIGGSGGDTALGYFLACLERITEITPENIEAAIQRAILKTPEWDANSAPPVITKIQYAK